ncbi:MAG: DsrE family protein [Bacteroidetes bacterium]|nr:DsrE family protein [Bacteroidota bacterium]
MKNIFLPCLLISSFFLQAQTDYKVVFDLTSKDTLDQRSVVRWLNEISKPNPNAKLEVVMYGQGFNFVLKDKSPYADAIAKLGENKNISFKVCNISLKNNNVDRSQLLSCVQIVPDGIYEIIRKQKEGWGYIKAVH